MSNDIKSDSISENSGQDLLDATQSAVIHAVENVSEIVETTETSTSTEVKFDAKHEPFYLETEFWVGCAFCLLVLMLCVPISKIVKNILKQKIDSVVNRIDRAVSLRDEAQKLWADYQRKLNDADIQAQTILDNALQKIENEKSQKTEAMEHELNIKRKDADTKINLAINNVKKEITDLMCNISIDAVTKICKNHLSEKDQDKLINLSIENLQSLSKK